MGKSKKHTEDYDYEGADIIYCSNRKCEETLCARHRVNQPWNKVMRMNRFSPDKNGVCKDYLD